MTSKQILWLPGLAPDYYNTFDDQFLKPVIDSQSLGAMQFGYSQNAVDPGPIQNAQPAPTWDANGGMSLSAVRIEGSGIVSRTVYLVPFPVTKLTAPNHLRFEVLFDLPNSLNSDSSVNLETWGLALNLKRGTAVDAGPDVDTPIGPVCQFHTKLTSPKGVRLTGIENIDPLYYLDSRTYDEYKADSTAFGVGADLTHTGLNYGGTAVLDLDDKSGNKIQPGNLNPQDFGNSTITNMAIGIALINLEIPGGTPPPTNSRTVSVRLRSFAIWMRPHYANVPDEKHWLLKHHRSADPQVHLPLQRL